jgi:hypothetical protein
MAAHEISHKQVKHTEDATDRARQNDHGYDDDVAFAEARAKLVLPFSKSFARVWSKTKHTPYKGMLHDKLFWRTNELAL